MTGLVVCSSEYFVHHDFVRKLKRLGGLSLPLIFACLNELSEHIAQTLKKITL